MTNWTTIYTRWKTPMQQMAFRYVKDHQLCQDIVQDIFLRLLEKNISVTFMDHAEKYLKTAVYHQCMTYFRRKVQMLSIDEWSASSAPSTHCTEDMVHYRELQSMYFKTIASLPQKQKEVIVLRQLCGYKRAEIATLLNKSAKTIKKQYHVSSQLVRESLKALRA